jgi:hypothetical protein
MDATTATTCANCGGTIGRLETPYAWGDYVVCGVCYQKLAARPVAAGPAADGDTIDMGTPTPQYQAPTTYRRFPKAKGPVIICPNPNCRYHGKSIKKAKGSFIVLLILLSIMVLPGLLYLIFFSGYTLICPNCGMKVRDA